MSPAQRTFSRGFGANKDSFSRASKTKNSFPRFPLLRLLRRLGYDPVQNRTSDIKEKKTRPEKQRQQKLFHRTFIKFRPVFGNEGVDESFTKSVRSVLNT